MDQARNPRACAAFPSNLLQQAVNFGMACHYTAHGARSSTTFMARACALQTPGLEIYDTIATAKSAANLVVRVEALVRTCSASFGQWKPPTHHLQLQEAQSYMFMGFACSSLDPACCQATPLLLQTLVSCNTFESKAAILPSVAKPSAHVSPVSM